jgi:hypothetical protein
VDGSPPGPAWHALQRASAEDRDRWQTLWVEEYRSIRSESEQARNAQQTILQWSLASFAAVIAGSLVMFQGSGKNALQFSGEIGTVLLFIFGLGLPGLGFFAYLVWWGELLRMERAGRYLRGLELVADRLARGGSGRFPPPLQWEHFLASSVYRSNDKTRSRAKHLVGYVGATGIYFGFSVSSLILYISLVVSHAYHLGTWSEPTRDLSLIWSAAYVCLFVGVTWYLRRVTSRRSTQGVLTADILPLIDFVPFGQKPETTISPVSESQQSKSSPLPEGGA